MVLLRKQIKEGLLSIFETRREGTVIWKVFYSLGDKELETLKMFEVWSQVLCLIFDRFFLYGVYLSYICFDIDPLITIPELRGVTKRLLLDREIVVPENRPS